ncbi:MAG: hypothetical protein R3C05_20950 [Pirellulaceae bacterium]
MSGWLLVNQNVQWTDRTRQQVNSRGLACETAHNWQTAQQRLQSHQYDVIIIDEAIDTGDEYGVIQHIAHVANRDKMKFVLMSDQTMDLSQPSDPGVIRCESMMLSDIDQLIRTVNC